MTEERSLAPDAARPPAAAVATAMPKAWTATSAAPLPSCLVALLVPLRPAPQEAAAMTAAAAEIGGVRGRSATGPQAPRPVDGTPKHQQGLHPHETWLSCRWWWCNLFDIERVSRLPLDNEVGRKEIDLANI